MRHALAIGVLVAALAQSASASRATGFAFGRSGGNIRPYTVVIAADGRVTTTGPVQVGRARLTSAQLGSLVRTAAAVRFATLPAATNCSGTLPDVASTFVRVGARTVRVHGYCVSRYTRLEQALRSAVKLTD